MVEIPWFIANLNGGFLGCEVKSIEHHARLLAMMGKLT
jgi:hypothetical protein